MSLNFPYNKLNRAAAEKKISEEIGFLKEKFNKLTLKLRFKCHAHLNRVFHLKGL